jgi:hypothetical protein
MAIATAELAEAPEVSVPLMREEMSESEHEEVRAARKMIENPRNNINSNVLNCCYKKRFLTLSLYCTRRLSEMCPLRHSPCLAA